MGFRLMYDTDDEADAAAAKLSELGTSAIKLMREVVENQEVERTKISKSAEALYSEGFIMILDDDFFASGKVKLRSRLSGEEALERLDELADLSKGAKVSKKEKRIGNG